MNKIKPGVCGICGTAVLQPETEKSGWHSGHYFKYKLKPNQTKTTELFLEKVRCMTHKESSDPRHYDKNGFLVEVYDFEHGCF